MKDEETDWSKPCFKMLIASVKWWFMEAYKLEFNDKAEKQPLKLILSERNSKTCCDSTLSSQQQPDLIFLLLVKPF